VRIGSHDEDPAIVSATVANDEDAARDIPQVSSKTRESTSAFGQTR
jgi:hypothetical protein